MFAFPTGQKFWVSYRISCFSSKTINRSILHGRVVTMTVALLPLAIIAGLLRTQAQALLYRLSTRTTN